MLRPYQDFALAEISKKFAQGKKRVLLHLATGAGKTTIFCEAIKRTVLRGNDAIMVVRGRKLVEQASARLSREGVHHGVLMNKHYLYRPNAPIQLCSIDTLHSRKLKPKAKLIVIDEAHLATSQQYRDFIQNYPDAFILSVTATPYPEMSMEYLVEDIVYPISVKELISQGFLVDAKYYAPYLPDLSKVKTRGKDYALEDLEDIMSESQVVGDIVKTWQQYGENLPTLCFAVSIKHSKQIVERFNKNDIPAVHIDADCTDEERNNAIKMLESGEIKIISNVGIFCTGVDIPCLGTIIMARSTKSYNLHIQQLGRGTRPFPNKNKFIVLDHAGNTLRHGFITDEKEASVSGKKVKGKLPEYKQCKICFLIYQKTCPNCGPQEKNEDTSRVPVFIDGELKEITIELKKFEAQDHATKLEWVAKKKNFSMKWVYNCLKKKYGESIARDIYPKWFLF